VQAAIDAVMNQAVFLAELVTSTRLGKPLGNDSGGTPQPDLQESPWADSSVADMQNTLTGIQNAYFGTLNGKAGPKGLSLIVTQRSPGTDTHVKDALKQAMKAVDAIPLPYANALSEHRDEVETAYEAVRDLKRVLATEVVTLLGAVLKFNDNDGD
jgi:predicted lipoprotein